MTEKVLNRKIVITKDGSQTLFIPELNEQYHSLNGAIQESLHVFIDAGLRHLNNLPELRIFEVGLGTALNAVLTFYHSNKQSVYYRSVEKYPLNEQEYTSLNFAEAISGDSRLSAIFSLLHTCPWNKNVNIGTDFVFRKDQLSLHKFNSTQKFNLIYFDAFAPDIQPDLWTIEVFQKMYNLLEPEGILVTYCAKGQVRRNMIEAGFTVERIPGPPGKRQMMRAAKF